MYLPTTITESYRMAGLRMLLLFITLLYIDTHPEVFLVCWVLSGAISLLSKTQRDCVEFADVWLAHSLVDAFGAAVVHYIVFSVDSVRLSIHEYIRPFVFVIAFLESVAPLTTVLYRHPRPSDAENSLVTLYVSLTPARALMRVPYYCAIVASIASSHAAVMPLVGLANDPLRPTKKSYSLLCSIVRACGLPLGFAYMLVLGALVWNAFVTLRRHRKMYQMEKMD
eukprot:PhM_4_TR9885/c0_g1_i1/m.61593